MCQLANFSNNTCGTPSRLRGNGICVTYLLTVAGPLQIYTGFRYCYVWYFNYKCYLVNKSFLEMDI